MEIGQTIYLKPLGNQVRYSKDIIRAKITKIGRKYFSIITDFGTLDNIRFFKDTLIHDAGGYPASYKVYFSIQEIERKNEKNRLYSNIRKKFSDSYRCFLSLDQLRDIDKIINQIETNL